MPDRSLLKKNAELQAALTKLRAEVALTHETLQAAKLCSISTVDLLTRMRDALKDIRRRTGPESVLTQAGITGALYDEIAEIHEIADSVLREGEQLKEELSDL